MSYFFPMLRQVNKGIKTLAVARLMSKAAAKNKWHFYSKVLCRYYRACAKRLEQ